MQQIMSKNRAGASRRALVGWLASRLDAHLRQRARDEQGVASVEFALVLPLLLILFLGASEMFLMSMASRKMTRVASTVGDLITQAREPLTVSDIEGYYAASTHIMGKLPTSNLALSVFTFKWNADTEQPELAWKEHLGGYVCKSNTPTLTPEQVAAMQDSNDLVITYGCYNYQIRIGSFVLGNKTLNMNDEIVLRPREQLHVPCKDCSI